MRPPSGVCISCVFINSLRAAESLECSAAILLPVSLLYGPSQGLEGREDLVGIVRIFQVLDNNKREMYVRRLIGSTQKVDNHPLSPLTFSIICDLLGTVASLAREHRWRGVLAGLADPADLGATGTLQGHHGEGRKKVFCVGGRKRQSGTDSTIEAFTNYYVHQTHFFVLGQPGVGEGDGGHEGHGEDDQLRHRDVECLFQTSEDHCTTMGGLLDSLLYPSRSLYERLIYDVSPTIVSRKREF